MFLGNILLPIKPDRNIILQGITFYKKERMASTGQYGANICRSLSNGTNRRNIHGQLNGLVAYGMAFLQCPKHRFQRLKPENPRSFAERAMLTKFQAQRLKDSKPSPQKRYSIPEPFPTFTGLPPKIRVATPQAWYKHLKSQNAQKCLRRVRKVFSHSRASQNGPVLGCFHRCETGFARCERLFWASRPFKPQITFSTLR